MIKSFLNAKHWQLFLLIFGIPMIFQFVMMTLTISNFASETNSDPSMIFDYMKFFPIIMILFMGVLFGWIWSVAIGLQNRIPENIKMNVRKFKFFFFTPLIYISFFLGFFIVIFTMSSFNPALFVIIIPLHLFSVFCMFYCLFFVSKTIKTVEFQREVTFSDFIGEFFMIWFYPIGIWIIQPKINKMVNI
ncbi:MAG: hypothetical protein ACOYO1_03460 [Bacteroidales bacterium]